MSKIKIGWAEESITPEKNVSLVGQFAERISKYVEKPLTVTAMAIDNGIEQAIIWDLMKAIERKIAKRRGLM